MPFIDTGADFKDAKETPLAPEGQLYDLVCDAADVEEDKFRIIVPIRFEGGEYRPMRHFINLPSPRDAENDSKQGWEAGTTRKLTQLNIKRFCYLFNIKMEDNGFDTDDIAGARARANVTISAPNAKGNTYNNIVMPRLPEES